MNKPEAPVAAPLVVPPEQPKLPIFAWAHNARMEFVHHEVKDLWLKVSPTRVENYTEALVLLEDVRHAYQAGASASSLQRPK